MARSKNKEQTKQRILKAIHDLLTSDGYKALGINRVAKAADVDKVLIYRYFGGLEGALEAFAETEDFWPSSDEIIGMPIDEFSQLPYLDQRKQLTKNTLRALRKRPQTLALAAWETVEDTPLTRILSEARTRQSLEIREHLKPSDYDNQILDEEVMNIVLGAAVHYLAISGSSDRPQFGIESGISWERIENTLDFIHDGINLAEQKAQE